MATWSLWSWDERNSMWLEVGEGTRREMNDALRRRRASAARVLPSARFTVTRQDQPPAEPPGDETP